MQDMNIYDSENNYKIIRINNIEQYEILKKYNKKYL